MRLSLVNSLQTPPGRHGLLIGENSWLSKCCFHLTLIFLTLIFVGFRPSKIHMALSLKTRNFNFGDPTTGRTPSCLVPETLTLAGALTRNRTPQLHPIFVLHPFPFLVLSRISKILRGLKPE